jgi:hypothetical protein
MNNDVPNDFKVVITSEQHSINLQLALFALGFKWRVGKETVQFTYAKYLLIRNKCITFSSSETTYKAAPMKEFDIPGCSPEKIKFLCPTCSL